MSAIDSKYHIKIDDKGFILDRNRNGIQAYQKKRAPQFVSKFGGGDSSYRDANFWQFWAQINWRNGAKQEKWGDGGKFWKSENVDTTQVEQLKLAKAFTSAGQVEAGAKVQALAAWRGSQNWWNANYGYRKQLTITAPTGVSLSTGYPIQLTEDTAALVTASKLRSDRNDWRVVYWNGTSWVDLPRHYVAASITAFGLQANIAAGANDTNYYLYYGYSGESTSKQPSSDADWNSTYGVFGTTYDDNTLAVWHFKEGTGTTVADTDGPHDITMGGSATWMTTNSKYGFWGTFSSGWSRYTDSGNTFNLGSVTVEALIRVASNGGTQIIVHKRSQTDDWDASYWRLAITSGVIEWACTTGRITYPISSNTTYWVAGTYDGSTTGKLYINGTLVASGTGFSNTSATSNQAVFVGGKSIGGSDSFRGGIAHVRISNTARSSFPYALSSEPTYSAGGELTTQPPSSSFTLYAGTNTGRIYSWDGNTTWTLAKDCNILEEYATGTDGDYRIGDTAGTEYKRAQSFKVDKDVNVKKVRLYLKATATAPTGSLTVRIETNSTTVPSGTLANANATGTIANFTTTTYGWVECEFTTAFQLTAATTYWIVVSCDAQANDVGWDWAGDASSPTYADGNAAVYSPSSWTAESGKDLYFRVDSTSTSVNVMFISSRSGTQKLYAGLGALTSQTDGDARLVTYDGSTWAMDKTFAGPTLSQVLSIDEFGEKLYVGMGPQGKIYETADVVTWTLSKDIDFPQKPGYPYALKEYSSQLIAMGGSPEFLPDKHYDGFAHTYNGTTWTSLYPFDHTVIRSAQFYDAFLFLGTYHGQLYTYNTAYLDPLFSFKDDYGWNVIIKAMKYFDDKLYIGLYPQDNSNETNVGVWVFERHGMTQIGKIDGITGVTSMEQVNNQLMVGTGDDGYVYKLELSTYVSTGWLQTSYFDANLPSIPKLWNQIVLNHDPLNGGETITLYYKYKESDSWTSLAADATQVAGDTTTTYTFPIGTSSNKITVKVVLNTTDTSKTPVVREYVMRYSLFPTTKWQWNMRIKAKSPLKLADGTTDARTGEQMRSDLEALLSDTQLHTFTDIDGTTHTVLFYDLDEGSWAINQEDTSGATVPVTLIEA